MQYELILTGKFKKSLKLAKKRGLDLKLLDKVITMLQNDIPLEEKYRDHELKGKYQGFRECHIQPDWLLIYLKENDVLTLTLVEMPMDTGIEPVFTGTKIVVPEKKEIEKGQFQAYNIIEDRIINNI